MTLDQQIEELKNKTTCTRLSPGLGWKAKQMNGATYRYGKVDCRPPAAIKPKKTSAPSVFCSWCYNKHAPDSAKLKRCQREQQSMTGTIDPEVFTYGMVLAVVE